MKNQINLIFLIVLGILNFKSVKSQSNDLICNATYISIGYPTSGDNSSAAATDPSDAAVTSAGYVCSTPNNSLWYQFFIPNSDTLKIISSSSSTGLNIWLGFFKASSCTGTLNYINCIKGATPGTSDTDEVILQSGNYFIMIDGFSGSVGDFIFSLETNPENDYCQDAIFLNNNAVLNTTYGIFKKFTSQSSPPIICNSLTSANAYDVWYKFTAVQNAAYVYVKGYNFDAVVGLYSGCGGILLQCSDFTFNNGLEKMLASNLTPGNTYYLRLYNRNSFPPINSFFYIGVQQYFGPAPANDNCSGATSLTPTSYPACNPYSGSVTNATTNLLYAQCSSSSYSGNDVWFKFVANAQNVDIEVSPSSLLFPVVALYDSCGGTLISAECNSSSSVTVEGRGLIVGKTYYVSVFSQNNFAVPGTTTFDICVKGYTSLPANAEFTFKLDITPAILNNIYTGGVPDITGNFNNYTPTANDDMDSLSPGIFVKTYNSFQVGDTVQYKFRINHNWSTWEVSSKQYVVNDRDTVASVWGDTSITIIDATYKLPIRFRINMSNETVSPDGLFIVGNFNNYDNDSTAMTPIGNGVYEAVVDLDTSSFIRYRYVNGLNISGAETVPIACGLSNVGGFNERFLDVPENADTLATLCFNECVNCVGYAAITFRVDLSGYLPVSPNGVHIAGSFNGWDYGANAMTSIGGNVYEAVLNLDTSSSIRYKFVNGNQAADAEVVPAACGIIQGTGGYKRYFTVTETPTTLANACFSLCSSGNCALAISENSPSEITIFYSNLTNEIVITSNQTAAFETISIYSITGKLNFSENKTELKKGTNYVADAKSLAEGIYFVSLAGPNFKQTKKLVVNR